MAITNVQSMVALLKISIDAGVTYKNIVCLSGWNFDGDTPITKEQTQCGQLTGLGANEWSFDVDAVVDTTPISTEVSYEDLLAYWNTNLLLYVKSSNPDPAGTDWYMQGTAYITKIKMAVKVGEFVKFNLTLTGTGVLDHTP